MKTLLLSLVLVIGLTFNSTAQLRVIKEHKISTVKYLSEDKTKFELFKRTDGVDSVYYLTYPMTPKTYDGKVEFGSIRLNITYKELLELKGIFTDILNGKHQNEDIVLEFTHKLYKFKDDSNSMRKAITIINTTFAEYDYTTITELEIEELFNNIK